MTEPILRETFYLKEWGLKSCADELRVIGVSAGLQKASILNL
jgi:hypothetical protein